MNFLFDEQMPVRLAEALKILGEPVRHVQEVIGKGTPDDQVLKFAAKNDYCLITLDRRIRTRPHEKAAYMAAGVGVYFIRGAKAMDGWEVVRIIFKHWQGIKADALKHTRPFMRLITSGGIRSFH